MEQTHDRVAFSEKIGYALADTGGSLFTSMIGTFMQMFYVDVLKIPFQRVGTLLLIIRLFSGINDPILGAFFDRRPPGKYGKYRPCLRNFSLPFAVMAVLLFAQVPGLSPTQTLIYAYITQIIYDIVFTAINIPMGAMASVITTDGEERSALSTFRSLGAGLGGLPSQAILPLLVFSTVMYNDNAVQVFNYRSFFIAVVVFSLVSIVVHNAAFKMTRERVQAPSQPQTHDIRHTIRVLAKNRSFLAICVASLLTMGSMLFSMAVNNFLFLHYFNQPALLALVAVAVNAPAVLLLPVLPKLVRRMGKKQLCACGLALSAAANFLLLGMRTNNPFVFIGLSFIGGIGQTFLNMQIWALLTDVLDKQELMSKKREEGTCYALFFATRKIGHTLAGAGSSYLLGAIGYVEGATVQPVHVPGRLYTVATLVPAIAFLLNFLTMQFWYPFSKCDEEEIRTELAVQRAVQEESANA
ncbi:MAG: glycoside-pentoside-hexuronide (GPH):cation symporter [Oscillospiraceae bacterium]|nr:glycoside-pentoside-hexuronide (GPH):cation symporter [Oscillospiraceae bacterium]